jgi:hypothetical protein
MKNEKEKNNPISNTFSLFPLYQIKFEIKITIINPTQIQEL